MMQSIAQYLLLRKARLILQNEKQQLVTVLTSPKTLPCSQLASTMVTGREICLQRTESSA